MYKRTPTGEYLVSVCTNTLCGMLGGDEIFAALKEQLGVGNNQTTRRRLDHPRARRVPGRLRLRAGGHRQLRVLRQPDRRVSARDLVEPAAGRRAAAAHAAARRCARSSRSSGRSPASTTTPRWRRTRTGSGVPTEVGVKLAHRARRHAPPSYAAPERRPTRAKRAGATQAVEPATPKRAAAANDRRGASRPARTTRRCRRPTCDATGQARPAPEEARTDVPLTPVLTKRFGTDQPWKIDNYERLDGYAGLRKALGHGAGRADRPGQGLQPARPRRRRLPDRHEVAVHPAGSEPASRTTSWSTPTRASRAPAVTCR